MVMAVWHKADLQTMSSSIEVRGKSYPDIPDSGGNYQINFVTKFNQIWFQKSGFFGFIDITYGMSSGLNGG